LNTPFLTWAWHHELSSIIRNRELQHNLNDTDSNGPVEKKSEQVRKISHEIRTSVHGLMGYVEIFKQETESGLSSNQLELLKRIDVYSHQVIDLVYDLLNDYEIKA
jgi:K+-sensing histidine kinase KdpD